MPAVVRSEARLVVGKELKRRALSSVPFIQQDDEEAFALSGRLS